MDKLPRTSLAIKEKGEAYFFRLDCEVIHDPARVAVSGTGKRGAVPIGNIRFRTTQGHFHDHLPPERSGFGSCYLLRSPLKETYGMLVKHDQTPPGQACPAAGCSHSISSHFFLEPGSTKWPV